MRMRRNNHQSSSSLALWNRFVTFFVCLFCYFFFSYRVFYVHRIHQALLDPPRWPSLRDLSCMPRAYWCLTLPCPCRFKVTGRRPPQVELKTKLHFSTDIQLARKYVFKAANLIFSDFRANWREKHTKKKPKIMK